MSKKVIIDLYEYNELLNLKDKLINNKNIILYKYDYQGLTINSIYFTGEEAIESLKKTYSETETKLRFEIEELKKIKNRNLIQRIINK